MTAYLEAPNSIFAPYICTLYLYVTQLRLEYALRGMRYNLLYWMIWIMETTYNGKPVLVMSRSRLTLPPGQRHIGTQLPVKTSNWFKAAFFGLSALFIFLLCNRSAAVSPSHNFLLPFPFHLWTCCHLFIHISLFISTTLTSLSLFTSSDYVLFIFLSSLFPSFFYPLLTETEVQIVVYPTSLYPIASKCSCCPSSHWLHFITVTSPVPLHIFQVDWLGLSVWLFREWEGGERAHGKKHACVFTVL